MTLQDVSQNLPSVASTLVNLQVSDELTELAKNMEGLLSRTNGAALFVNGRRVPIDHPSFNVFEFLNVMKEEQAELEKMQTRLSPFLSREGSRGFAEIARGFILAYRIAKKVIDCGGENTFLQKQEFHSRVREDFYDTPHGVSKKTRVVD
jgi:hypothetical protein